MDVLILLFGGNPMPNFVTAKYLLNEKRKDMEELPVPGKFVFVYSGETERFKNSLTSCLGLKESAYKGIGLGECERTYSDIKERLEEKLDGLSSVDSVHLNYTGGTKQMSVAAFQAVSEFCGKKKIKPVFSYLDPENFKLITPGKSGYPTPGDLRDWVVPSIGEIYKIHCLEEPKFKTDITDEYSALYGDMNKLTILRSDDFRTNLIKFEEENKLNDKKSSKIKKWFNKRGGSEKFKFFLNDNGIADCKVAVTYEAYQTVVSEWLEQRVFKVLSDLREDCRLGEVAWNVEGITREDSKKFEIDVIAMHGYQPIVFSCTTDSKEGLIKQKAFEVNYRSVQLGGEHAKRVMVCLGDEDVCEGVKEDMSQFDAVKHFEIIGREQVEDDEKLRNAIKSILEDPKETFLCSV